MIEDPESIWHRMTSCETFRHSRIRLVLVECHYFWQIPQNSSKAGIHSMSHQTQRGEVQCKIIPHSMIWHAITPVRWYWWHLTIWHGFFCPRSSLGMTWCNFTRYYLTSCGYPQIWCELRLVPNIFPFGSMSISYECVYGFICLYIFCVYMFIKTCSQNICIYLCDFSFYSFIYRFIYLFVYLFVHWFVCICTYTYTHQYRSGALISFDTRPYGTWNAMDGAPSWRISLPWRLGDVFHYSSRDLMLDYDGMANAT